MAATAAAIASGSARSMLSRGVGLSRRGDDVDGDRIATPLPGGGPRQAAHGFLGDVVPDGPGVPDHAVPGREVDDPVDLAGLLGQAAHLADIRQVGSYEAGSAPLDFDGSYDLGASPGVEAMNDDPPSVSGQAQPPGRCPWWTR